MCCSPGSKSNRTRSRWLGRSTFPTEPAVRSWWGTAVPPLLHMRVSKPAAQTPSNNELLGSLGRTWVPRVPRARHASDGSQKRRRHRVPCRCGFTSPLVLITSESVPTVPSKDLQTTRCRREGLGGLLRPIQGLWMIWAPRIPPIGTPSCDCWKMCILPPPENPPNDSQKVIGHGVVWDRVELHERAPKTAWNEVIVPVGPVFGLHPM